MTPPFSNQGIIAIGLTSSNEVTVSNFVNSHIARVFFENATISKWDPSSIQAGRPSAILASEVAYDSLPRKIIQDLKKNLAE